MRPKGNPWATTLQLLSSPDGGFAIHVPRNIAVVHLQPLGNASYYGGTASYYGGETGFTNDTSRVLALEADGPVAEGIVIPFGIISGRVVGSQGRPVVGAHVYTRPGASAPARTGVSGRFRIAVSPGDRLLEIRCPHAGGGWYGGDTGLSYDPGRAVSVGVSISDVGGIVITLPMDRSEVLSKGCPRPLSAPRRFEALEQ